MVSRTERAAQARAEQGVCQAALVKGCPGVLEDLGPHDAAADAYQLALEMLMDGHAPGSTRARRLEPKRVGISSSVARTGFLISTHGAAQDLGCRLQRAFSTLTTMPASVAI